MKNILAIIIFIIPIVTQAKWAGIENAPVKMSLNQSINVDSTGLTKETREIQFEILKEPGRYMASSYTIKYNSASEKVRILEAKTIYNNKEYKLEEKLLEDKPLASSHAGFDQIRQILLAFPKAEIGAKIYLKYIITTTAAPLPNFYSSLFTFGDDEFIEKACVKINSKIPLHILINDPEKYLNIKQDAQKENSTIHNLEINLLKPIYKSTINEPRINIINHKYLPWVSVSSLAKWEDLGLRFGELYAKVFTQKLPQDFANIANMAAKQKNEIDQINTVTSLLNTKIQYMGDWRTIHGKFIPRELTKISKTQLGDCKDFSAATAAILAQLGFKTQVALIRRGERSFYPETLPDTAAFNHAFVKVKNKQGKIYWIDPTNFQSMADGIFPDIANKITLVLDTKNPSYEKTSNINPEHAISIITRQIEVLDNNKILESGQANLKNENAYRLTGAILQTSEANIKDLLFNSLSHSRLEDKNKKSLQLPKLDSRIVKDISFTYSFDQDNKIVKTNLGQALKLYNNFSEDIFDVSKDYVTDNFIDNHPATYISTTIIKNITAQNIESLNKEIKTPWLYVKRVCSINKDNNLQIDNTVIIYKNLISNNELKTPEFIAFKDDLEKNFKDVAIVFTKNNI